MCLPCKLLLYDLDHNTLVTPLFDFSLIHLDRQTRSKYQSDCSCQICCIALENAVGKPGEDNYQRTGMVSPKPGRPQTQAPAFRQPSCGPMTICKKCYARFGPGLRHNCNPNKIADNLLQKKQGNN